MSMPIIAVETVLLLMLRSLELTIKIIDTMPPESHKAAWERHDKRMAFVEKVADFIFKHGDDKEEPKPKPTP